MVDSSKTYKPPNYTENKGNDDLSPDKYFQHILNSRAAFAPKSYSNAYLFRSKRDGKAPDIDDDGCAIFWKKEILKPVELGFLRVPSDTEKSEAVLALTLQHLETDMTFNVITTHLPSGDEPKKELERLAVLNNPSARWTARRICFDDTSWKELPYENNANFVGITSYVKYFAQRKDTQTIFALDANSRPSFPRIKSDSSSDETNVWHTILSQTTLESIWVQNACIKENGESSDPKNPFVVSVNKMRGPSSNQPPKIGEHQLELIDHVFTNGKKSELVTHVDFNKKDFVPTAPKRYISKEGDAEIDLFPSSTMPSDHLPVVVNITM
uniref:Endonuclease/exonuclease/phosphatase domain-containing protein n=1 Tax=Ditylum brightwellii TaxID=49249 RepID=A0A7S4W6S5_9STRA